jgi:hypothetical protein
MTVAANARLAGVTYFVYISAGMSMLLLAGRPEVTGIGPVLTSLSAIVLGVTLYAITRAQDPDLALLAMGCRFLEAAPGDGYVYFAVSNVIFCWLLLKGGLIPATLARLGLAASVLLVISLVLQRTGLLAGGGNWGSNITWIASLPMLVYELTFATWLLTKGVSAAPRLQPTA